MSDKKWNSRVEFLADLNFLSEALLVFARRYASISPEGTREIARIEAQVLAAMQLAAKGGKLAAPESSPNSMPAPWSPANHL
jgi:hypothetical protein